VKAARTRTVLHTITRALQISAEEGANPNAAGGEGGQARLTVEGNSQGTHITVKKIPEMKRFF
jgi:hypothetical protein